MLIKNYLNKILILGIIGTAILTQPAQSYVSGLGFGLPVVSTVAFGVPITTFGIAGHQKYQYDGVYSNGPSQNIIEVEPPDGATVIMSSVPVVIQNQVSKDKFTVNIPNDKGGYSTVILQKLGNRFIGLPGEFFPEFPKVI